MPWNYLVLCHYNTPKWVAKCVCFYVHSCLDKATTLELNSCYYLLFCHVDIAFVHTSYKNIHMKHRLNVDLVFSITTSNPKKRQVWQKSRSGIKTHNLEIVVSVSQYSIVTQSTSNAVGWIPKSSRKTAFVNILHAPIPGLSFAKSVDSYHTMITVNSW